MGEWKMDKENNIDDLLKLLKNSYGGESESNREESIPAGDSGEDMSSDALQKQLRDRFADSADAEKSRDPERDEFTYTLDDSFFEDVEEEETPLDTVAELVEALPTEEETSEDAAEETIEDDEPPFDIIADEDDEADEPVLELVEDTQDEPDEALEEPQPIYAEDDRFNYRQESEDSAFSFFGDGFEEEIEEETEEEIEEAVEEEVEEDLHKIIELPTDEPEVDLTEDVGEEIVDDEYSEDDVEGMFVEDENGDIVFVSGEGAALEDSSYFEDEEEPTPLETAEMLEAPIEEEPIEEEPWEQPADEADQAEDPIRVPSKFKTLITGYDASEEKYDKYVAPAEEPEKAPEAESAEEEVNLGEYFSGSDGQLAMFEDSADESDYEPHYSEESAPEERDSQIALELDEAQRARINKVVSDAPISEIDDGILSVLLEVDDKEIIAESVSEEKMESFIFSKNRESERINAAEAFAFDGAEYENYEQTEEVFDAYSKEKTFTLIRVIGCGLFTTLIVIFELLRFIGVEFEGILDYTVYPFIYTVISVQLLVFAALFAWRELLRGFKRAFTYNVSNWSAVSIVFGFTVIYSFICAFMALEYNSHVFCSVSALYILFGLVTEYISVCREVKSFKIYATNKTKFTFNTDPKTIQSAEKMHRGGVSQDSRIFEPAEIKFPRGYFSAVNSDRIFERSLHGSVAAIVAASVLVLLASVIMGGSAEESIAMFMIALCALAPISSLAYHTFPMYKLSSRLYSREIAVAGEKMAEKYAECEYMVLSDMHLFRRAQPHNNGIFICNDEKTDTIIEYLDALYSAIGGPMKEMFSSGEPTEHSVKLRRIAKDGVEAVIDTRHSVLLGNAEFLKRYGVFIGDMTPKRRGEGILGFAIDGMPAAKLCVRYETEPLFELLAERLAENGIICAIETYDPAINSKFAAECRDRDAIPVNIIHKNANDYYSASKIYRKESTGMVVCSSRLKLIEAVIWCKHISRIWRICSICQYVMYGLAFALAAVVTVLGLGEYVNQYTVLLMQIIAALPTIIATLLGFPDRDYFSLETEEDN